MRVPGIADKWTGGEHLARDLFDHWISELHWRRGPKDPLVQLVLESDRRKKRAVKALRAADPVFGTQGQFRGVLDAFHGETHFKAAPEVTRALTEAWAGILAGTARLEESDGSAYDKRSPRILRELSARLLFRGLQIRPDEVVVAPYSSTVLVEEACATVARPGGVILSPEGFYKGNALHVSKYGLRIRTVPLSESYKLEPAALTEAIRRAAGSVSALLLTMPGNPILVDYSAEELRALGEVILKHDLRVICDSVFDQVQERFIPLASIPGLYDRVLTIAGNSKGHSAFGPCKFGAACTGDEKWRTRLSSRLTTLFQRETTELCRTVLENTPAEYFETNRRTMRAQQDRANALLEEVNRRAGKQVLAPIAPVREGMFLSVRFGEDFLQASGVQNGLELEDFLLLGQGVNSTCFARMGSTLPALRLNVLAPRKDGVKDPAYLAELFDRIEKLISDVRGGLCYSDVISRLDPETTATAA